MHHEKSSISQKAWSETTRLSGTAKGKIARVQVVTKNYNPTTVSIPPTFLRYSQYYILSVYCGHVVSHDSSRMIRVEAVAVTLCQSHTQTLALIQTPFHEQQEEAVAK